MKKLAYLLLILITSTSCVNNHKYRYEVHLRDGSGTMHLYTGSDYKDAVSYIKQYEKSHGDMKIVPSVRDSYLTNRCGRLKKN